ncbi:MAG TPA: glycine zipper 2TM domain-containing protein [Burkholderiaceae bacterium]|jgi:outer membrane lipoprotein SlyB|nr:glycine zipper 2TM domain-containing protein [Burkholderiaceae bacterium]
MTSTTPRTRAFRLALVASAALALGACSKSDSDAASPNAAASMPSTVALAPTPAPLPASSAPVTPAAPVVVAQNESQDKSAYEAGRRDQRRQDARRTHERSANSQLPPRADRDADVRQNQRVAAAPCADCGVVEAVTEVKVQGQTNGVGVLAGGATGALLGNRIAGNNNRTLGGVVGAVGGGLIGNAIEKHQRQGIAYDVNVRMEDGTLRTVREATAPAIGAKVRVESDGLHQRT